MSSMKFVVFRAVAIIALACLAGCAEPHQNGNFTKAKDLKLAERVEKLAKTLEEIIQDDGGTIIITGEDLNAIRKLTCDTLWQGDQDSLAQIILEVKSGKRRNQMCYKVLADAFAQAWKDRTVPIRMGASEQTIKALKAIAESKDSSRNAKIAAATAISKLYPKIAEAVLLEEYGDIYIPRWQSGWPGRMFLLYSGRPRADWYYNPLNSDSLLSRQTHIPSEIVSVDEAKEILLWRKQWRLEQELDSNRVSAAIRAYNKKVRELYLAKKYDELSDIYREEYLKKCLDAIPEDDVDAPPPHEGPGLFGPDPDDDFDAGSLDDIDEEEEDESDDDAE